MAKVVLDREYFEQTFPHINITNISDFVLDLLWELAVSFVGDDEKSPYAYAPEKGEFERRKLLYLALAHIVQLQLQSQQNASSGLVGRITSATEGSVSVSVETFKANSFTAQWWQQTPEGQMYWLLTAKTRLPRLYVGSNYHPWG